ncbi:hypothetical protein [Vibrio sp. CAU 1672]|uniref:hypothetical protein n=1 Tax=Vibrio sp. CAU 1672 TaxID=3032594 RepID=UPI0023DC0015|nr:hypothetical protein [Vibrio sp. CAU 1672]MDF2153832.1 hypothetical protein [Vibrio sp. CAU 1672]
MERYCPICRTEMVDRNRIAVCPRNDIGECSYDGYLDHQMQTASVTTTPQDELSLTQELK